MGLNGSCLSFATSPEKRILAYACINSTPGDRKFAVSPSPNHGVRGRGGAPAPAVLMAVQLLRSTSCTNGNSFIWNDSFVMAFPQIFSGQYWIFRTIVWLLFDLVEGGNLLESTQTVRTMDRTANVGRVPEFVDTIANLDIATIVGPFDNKEGSSQQGLFDILFYNLRK